MTDIVDRKTRSRLMAGIKGKDTTPEMKVRKALHSRGFRYSLHSKKLPGKPDIVLPKHGCLLFINGCFWHGHNCRLFKWPQSRKDFWRNKITATKKRDKQKLKLLIDSGWRVAIVWECSIKGRSKTDFSKMIEELIKWILGNSTRIEFRGA